MLLLWDFFIKWFLIYLRILCELMGWKRAAAILRKMVKEEPDFNDEKHIM